MIFRDATLDSRCCHIDVRLVAFQALLDKMGREKKEGTDDHSFFSGRILLTGFRAVGRMETQYRAPMRVGSLLMTALLYVDQLSGLGLVNGGSRESPTPSSVLEAHYWNRDNFGHAATTIHAVLCHLLNKRY